MHDPIHDAQENKNLRCQANRAVDPAKTSQEPGYRYMTGYNHGMYDISKLEFRNITYQALQPIRHACAVPKESQAMKPMEQPDMAE